MIQSRTGYKYYKHHGGFDESVYTIENFPMVWQEYGMPLSGYGSYELEILLDTKGPLSLEVDDILTNYRLYWNGEFIGGLGQVGQSEATTVPENKPERYTLEDIQASNSLVIEVSDYDLGKGGINRYFILESPFAMSKRVKINLAKDVFIMSSFLAISFVSAIRAFTMNVNGKDISLTVLLFLLSLRLLFVNERIALNIFDQMTWETLYRIILILLLGVIVMFFNVLMQLHRNEQLRRIAKIAMCITALFMLLVLCCKPIVLSRLLDAYFMTILILGIVFIYVVIREKIYRIRRLRTAMMGYSLVLGTMAIDIIAYAVFKVNLNSFQLGVVIFVYLIMYAIFDIDQYRANQNLKLKDVLQLRNNELSELNRVLEKKVKERTEELADKNKILEDLSQRDSLTGFYNHNTIIAIAKDFLEEHPKSNLSVVMIDIDHFKKVNDKYGHPIGDEVIIEFGNLLKHTIKPYGTIGRYGGEEFMLILQDMALEEAYEIVNEMRNKVCDMFFSKEKLQITFSAGIADNVSGHIVKEIINNADQKLYLAKHSGRNQVMI